MIFLLTTPIMSFFFFDDPATPQIYTLSLHDALPIYPRLGLRPRPRPPAGTVDDPAGHRSEEHTSELQSRRDLVCRLLLEKKNRIRRRASRDPVRDAASLAVDARASP